MRRAAAAFTLVELILVMTLVVVFAAVVAPMLASSMRGRGLAEEATRFVSLTEFARSEAVSQGIPMSVWIDPGAAQYGFDARTGYELANGQPRTFTAPPDVKIEVTKAAAIGNRMVAADFGPDGTLSLDGAETVRFTDRFGTAALVARTSDGWGYELSSDSKNAQR